MLERMGIMAPANSKLRHDQDENVTKRFGRVQRCCKQVQKRRSTSTSFAVVLALVIHVQVLGVARGLHFPVVPVEVVQPASLSTPSRVVTIIDPPLPWVGSTGTSTHLAKATSCTTNDPSTCFANTELNTLSSHFSPNSYEGWISDTVLRVVDANTVKLEKQGQVSLSAVQMPSPAANFQFPECFDKSPSYELRRLLPRGTPVRIQLVIPSSSTRSSSRSRNNNNYNNKNALIVRASDGTLVNAALVEKGYGRVKNKCAKQSESYVPGLVELLAGLQVQAQSSQLGIYQSCNNVPDQNTDSRGTTTISTVTTAVFEPMDSSEDALPTGPPPNPGDRRSCADFDTYEDALRYYEMFLPYYGDVARLDRDRDGVPCPGLPHTTNRDLYRMKIPTARHGMGVR